MKQTKNDFMLSSLSGGFGNKARAIKEFGLNEFIPPMTSNKQIYFEPFTYSGVMFFNLHKVWSAILNDKDDLIWNFLDCVKNRREELEKELEFVWIGKKWFEAYLQRTDPIGKAVWLYLALKASHKGIIEPKFRYKIFLHPFKKDFTPWKEKMDQMASFSFWNDDFRVAYQKLDHYKPNTLTNLIIFADPPYVDIGKYRINFTKQDHLDLADIHNQIKDHPNRHIFITYNNHPFIQELYKGWYQIPITWCNPSKGGNTNEYEEILISNRPIQRYSYTKEGNGLQKFIKKGEKIKWD